MKLWRCVHTDNDIGVLQEWHRTRRDAMRARAAIQEAFNVEVEVSPIDVPLSKSALLEFLNTYAKQNDVI